MKYYPKNSFSLEVFSLRFKKFQMVLLSVWVLFGVMGCRHSTPKTTGEKFLPPFVYAQGKVVYPDSTTSVKTFPASEPVSSKAVVSDITPYHTHRIKAREPQKTRASGIKTYTLNQDSLMVVEQKEIRAERKPMGLAEIIPLKEAKGVASSAFSMALYSKIHGLPHDDVSFLFRDSRENIWISTFGGGVSRFDGKNLSIFNRGNVLSVNSVKAITEDLQGNIWLASWGGGVYKFDGTYVYNYTAEAGLVSNNINFIETDARGNIWITYDRGGLTRYDGTYFYNYQAEDKPFFEEITGLKVDTEGNIWISSYMHGLIRFDGRTLQKHTIPFQSPQNPVMSLGLDHENNIWLGVHDMGAVRFDGEYFSLYTLQHNIPSARINIIQKDSQGKMWFGSWGQGLFSFDGEYFSLYNQAKGLSNNYIQSLCEDANGSFWIGHHNGGITRYFADVFKHYNLIEGFKDGVSSIVRDKEGHLWISSDRGGIMKFDGKNFTLFSVYYDSYQESVGKIIIDQHNNLWVANRHDGLLRFDGTHFHQYIADDSQDVKGSGFVIEDSNGHLWFTQEDGLVQYDMNNFYHYTTENGLPDASIGALREDSNGNIWMTTWGLGIAKFDGEKFTHFGPEQGFKATNTYTLFEDSFGNIWIGSENLGLFMYNGEGFMNFTSEDGLLDNFIFSILQDAEGNLIIGSRFGLNIMPQATLEKINPFIHSFEPMGYQHESEILFYTLSYREGFAGIGCNRDAIFLDHDGTVWIGANDRLTAFMPHAMRPDTIPPKLAITNIGLFNESVNWFSAIDNQDTVMVLSNGIEVKNFSFEDLSQWHGIPRNLKLTHHNNFITFSFIGTTTNSPDKVKYSYKLEGLDDYWHTPTSKNQAHYGNIPPGSYTFRVRAMNAQGHWSDEYHASFIIKTPWWRTNWAYIFYYISGVLLILLLIRLREKSLILKNRLLDKEVEVARKTIEFKQNILANVSHELRTPLTGILGLTDVLKKTSLDTQQKSYLESLEESGGKLMEIITQVLDYTDIDSGMVTPVHNHFIFRSMMEKPAAKFRKQLKNQNIGFTVYIDPQIPEILIGDDKRVQQIINHLLSNAHKFTKTGKIELQAHLAGPLPSNENNLDPVQIKIQVKDTGVGIAPQAMDSLFEPLSQIELNDARDVDSTGLGLAISKKLTQLLGGEIGVESEKGKGSTFWFTFKAEIAESMPEEQKTDQAGALPVSPGDTDTASALSILFVEDKRTTQLLMKMMLESMGHSVRLAENGQEALDICKEQRFDVILMDIQMPVMDGITATQILKKDFDSAIPIVGVSANSFEGAREKYMRLGMDEFITKPVDEKTLKRTLAKVLS